jgi:hypothetical protein
MAEQRFERDVRTMLAQDLGSIHGPHSRWADAPVARRIERGRGTTRRWPVFAAFAAATLAVVVMVAVVGSPPAVPPTSSPATASASVEPWPATVDPNTAPTVGEVPLGRVAVVTQFSMPVLLVRVSSTTSLGVGDITVRVEFRVVAPLQEPVGLQRLVVIRDGRQEVPGLGIAGPDPLALPAGTPSGVETSTIVSIPAGATENVELGYISSRSQLAFSYQIHAFVPALAPGGCPTLADYLAVAAAPTATPMAPLFPPVTADTKVTVGVLTPGQVGVLAAPDGSPGALFRISNPRFCDRLPDERPETYLPGAQPGDFRLLLADVELTVIKSGTLPGGFIPGSTAVWAKFRQSIAIPDPVPFDFPGSNGLTTLNVSEGFSYRGTMSWAVEGAGRGGRLTIQVGLDDVASFEYLIQDGSTDRAPRRPLETPAPGATPSTGDLALDTWATVSADGALMPVFVGGVAVVDGYPRVMPSTSGDKFMEVFTLFGVPSATYTIDPSDWVLVGPDGRDLPRLKDPGAPDNQLLPWFAIPWTDTRQVSPPDAFSFPAYAVAEVPPTGRITLEYRPHGGPAQATWIVRDH